jgi:hypothetical protein
MEATLENAKYLYFDAVAFTTISDLDPDKFPSTVHAATRFADAAKELYEVMFANKTAGNPPVQEHLDLANKIITKYNQTIDAIKQSDASFGATLDISYKSTGEIINLEKLYIEESTRIGNPVSTNTSVVTTTETAPPAQQTQIPPEKQPKKDLPPANKPTPNNTSTPPPQSDDYDKRTTNLSNKEVERINTSQVPNEKESAEDNEPDILDTLSVGSDGLVVVSSERRNQLLSGDGTGFSYNYTPGQYGMPRKGPVDASNITVKNTGFSISVVKSSETDGEIIYKIKIENDGKNCLYLDQIIEISGTDLSNVNPDTKKSQFEPTNLGTNGVSTNITDNTTFIKNFVSNVDNLQSQTNAPFSVGVPQHLKQKDNQSEPLCSTNSEKKEEDKGNNNSENKEQQSDKTDSKKTEKEGKVDLSKLQIETINESEKWVGFYEDTRSDRPNTKDFGENKPNVRVDETGNIIVDTSLMENMFKYAGWSKAGGLKWPYCMSFAFMVAYKGALAAGDSEYLKFLDEARKKGLATSTQGFYRYAKEKGFIFQTPVPGCVVILQSLKDKSKGHGIIIGKNVEVWALENKKWVFETVQANTSGETGTALTEGVFYKTIGFKPDGVSIVVSQDGIPYFRYLGCIVPESIRKQVGETDEILTKAFVTDWTNEKE